MARRAPGLEHSGAFGCSVRTARNCRVTSELLRSLMQVRFPTADFAGDVITHCHILEHEDGGMMGQFKIHGTHASRARRVVEPGVGQLN